MWLLGLLYLSRSCDAIAVFDHQFTTFVTRPEIQAPILQIDVHDQAQVIPGYWFLSPYEQLNQDPKAATDEECRTGPHIYDGNGDLVWSGACEFKGQNFCDFRVVEFEQEVFLTGILYQNYRDDRGRAVVMNTSYYVIHDVFAPPAVRVMNMHDFILRRASTGPSGIHLMTRTRYVDVHGLKIKGKKAGWVADGGIREADLESGHTLFEWWGGEHLDVSESRTAVDTNALATKQEGGWNWLHPNSVDKNEDGDYLLSARFTDCIYKISGKDGSIIWKLGGSKSSFSLAHGWNFSRQHDARWVSYDDEREMISFFDNSADHLVAHSATSSGVLVEIDKVKMTAKAVKRWWRPDGKLSRLRGNLQMLPSGNVIGGWSDHCYWSEHSADGKVLLEARALDEHVVTYRTYKFNFTGAPIDRPRVKAFANHSPDGHDSVDIYVSWNGATEVGSWRFRNQSGVLATNVRTGFETKVRLNGIHSVVYAEALATDGSVLGSSELCEVERSTSRSLDALAAKDGDGHGKPREGEWVERSEL